MSQTIQDFRNKPFKVQPDGAVVPGIEGVVHGPYQKTDEHIDPVAEGNSRAITAAFHAGRIDADTANTLQQRGAEVERLQNPAHAEYVRKFGPATIGHVAIGVEYIQEPAQAVTVHHDK